MKIKVKKSRRKRIRKMEKGKGKKSSPRPPPKPSISKGTTFTVLTAIFLIQQGNIPWLLPRFDSDK